MKRVGVLVSGRGSNLQALIDAARGGQLGAEIAVVVSNVESAYALDRARRAGIDAVYRDHRGHSREAYDHGVLDILRGHGVDIVCLAGFMRVLSPVLVRAYPRAILNIHPSLLPAFPGLDAQRQALEHGVKVTGATVHLVDEGLDSGPIVLQEAVPVKEDEMWENLVTRILDAEHRIYPEAVRILAASRWRLDGRRFVVEGA